MKYKLPLTWLVISIVFFSITTWIIYPSWSTRQYGLLEMILTVSVGTLAFAAGLVSFVRHFNALQGNETREGKTVEAKGAGSVAIGGDANNANISTSVGTSKQGDTD